MSTDSTMLRATLDGLAEIRHTLAPLLGVDPDTLPAIEMAEALACNRAVRDVLTERAKQRAKWGDAHDDGHTDDEMQFAAAYVCSVPEGRRATIGERKTLRDHGVEWACDIIDKHTAYRDRLVIAAALLLAEIERVDRKEASP